MGKRQKDTADAESSSAKVKRTRKSASKDAPSQRSSVYRGVTRHRWTGRYEAHLWDKNCWNEAQKKRGKQVYLGAYDDEEAAAHAYDLAALKYWGHETVLNFQLSSYQEELKEMEGQSREEYIGTLRRKSSGFSRGVSKYRGVARHHHSGRWEARIGRVLGNKYLYLGTYATEEEAAVAYDMAAIEHRGHNAVTNFDLSRYSNLMNGSGGVQTANIAASSTSSNSSATDDLGHSFQLLQDQLQLTETVSQDPAGSESAFRQLHRPLNFQEMAAVSSSSASSSSSSPPPPVHGSRPSRCSFPDYIQTYFESHDGGRFIEEEDGVFGDFDAFVSSLFQYELGT